MDIKEPIIEIADHDDEQNTENDEDQPIINIVLNPEDLQTANTINGNPPLFIKKLWKIVNDENNEDIIGWNDNGDGFIIHDQLQFISQTLPRYFKHNQMSSFVRQLNLYDFHKIQQIEKDVTQFNHPFFLKDLPQLLPLIKRKNQQARQKAAAAAAAASATNSDKNPRQSSEVQELMTLLKDVKNRSDGITMEMSKLRQENAALWGEMNSLRLKYSKQTKIINKLIHFLITYMQKHHNGRKPGRIVSTSNSNKYLKTGPKIMELDYRYKNNPYEFWSDFDNNQNDRLVKQKSPYTVMEPVEPNLESAHAESSLSEPRVVTNIEEILPNSSPFNQPEQTLAQSDYNRPSSSKTPNSALQRSRGSKEHLGYLIDNSRVEMNTIKELLKNLSSDDVTNFYKLVNENYKNQEDDLSLDIDSVMPLLGQMSPLTSSQENLVGMQEEDLGDINKIIDQDNDVAAASVPPQDSYVQDFTNFVDESARTNNNDKIEVPSLGVLNDDLLHTDDLLNNVSLGQYFNMD